MKNIGVDLTRISRFENASPLFAKRILSQEEYIQYNQTPQKQQALFLARFWAIKEAIFKANNKYYQFNLINITKHNHRYCFADFSISISHDGDLLVAVALENQEPYENSSTSD